MRASDLALVAGHGGPGVWVNGVRILPPSAGNDPAWLGERVLCNDQYSQLVTVDETGGTPHLLDPRGATRVATDPDVPEAPDWAAFLQDGTTGLYTSWGLSVPAGELYGMRGRAVFGRQVLLSDGGLCAWAVGDPEASHLLWSEPSAVVVEFAALSAHEVLWTDGARQIHTYGLPAPAQTTFCFAPVIFDVNGALFLCEWRDQIGLVVRPWDDADHGWIVYAGEAFGTCGTVDGTEILLAWSLNIAEQGEPMRGLVDVTTPMIAFVPPSVPCRFLSTACSRLRNRRR
jgi:hypothetical protein